MAIGEEVDFFLGEVDGGFDIDAQGNQLLGQCMYPAREFALQGTQCIARGLLRAGLDQIGDGFGLGQVELVVEERALAELARSRLAGAQFQTTLHQQVEYHGAAVPL